MDFGFFTQLLVIFSLSIICIAIFHRLRISETLAYLVVGLLLGPTTTGIIDSSFDISLLAEIGVVFLLFSLGLEFSLSNVKSMKKIVFGLGGLQVLISTVLIGFCALLLDFSYAGALVMAGGLSLSSTAIVSKELTRRNELKMTHGQLAIGTLIFQDIAAVFFLIVIPTVGGVGDNGFLYSLSVSLFKGVVFVGVMIFLGHGLMPKVFHEIARGRSEELFVLTAIVVALLAAYFTHLLSLSMALGGFVAGMMLGESHYRHQIQADIRPFRDIFLGLFFVSVGLMIDVQLFLSHWHLILLGSICLILFKSFLISLLSYFVFQDMKVGIKTGLSLAQGGEFCFALVALGTQNNFLLAKTSSVILSVTIVSMAVTPLLIRYSEAIASFIINPRKPNLSTISSADMIRQATEHMEGHIIICGYGRVGQAISRFLDKDDIPFIVIDDDPVHVKAASKSNFRVFYGDCRREDLLKSAGADKAKLVAICINHYKNTLATLRNIRKLNTNLKILVRTRDDSKMDTLKQEGATEVFPEVLESSLLIISHVLNLMGHHPGLVSKRIDTVRREHYNLLHGSFLGCDEILYDKDGTPQTFLHVVTLTKNSRVIGIPVSEIDVIGLRIEIQKLTRNSQNLLIADDPKLMEGDNILISGTNEDIAQAQTTILKP